MRRSSRTHAMGISAGVLIASLALLVPSIALAASFTVPAIPGAGWVQSTDNTAGGTAVIAANPAGAGALGTSSLKLTTAANTDFAGIGRLQGGPLSDLTGASWMTFVTGATGSPASEAPSLRFAMYRIAGQNEFSTMTVERSNQGTVTAGVWETTTLSDTTMVWQTNQTGAFCLIASPCTYAAFKAAYPEAHLLGLSVAIGTGVPAVTSYADGVSLTVAGATDTWNFELAPKATPRPTKTPVVTTPPTDNAAPMAPTSSVDGRVFIVLGAVSLIALLAVRPRRTRPTR